MELKEWEMKEIENSEEGAKKRKGRQRSVKKK